MVSGGWGYWLECVEEGGYGWVRVRGGVRGGGRGWVEGGLIKCLDCMSRYGCLNISCHFRQVTKEAHITKRKQYINITTSPRYHTRPVGREFCDFWMHTVLFV